MSCKGAEDPERLYGYGGSEEGMPKVGKVVKTAERRTAGRVG
jgi:hypothetical protein